MLANHPSVLLTTITFALAACSSSIIVENGERAVSTFHDRYNRRQFELIYVASDPALKEASDMGAVVQYLTSVSDRMGAVRRAARTGSGVAVTRSGRQIKLEYRTEFTNGVGSEQFTWRVHGDSVRLIGYTVTQIF
jgi:hypothetical protein